MEINNFSIRGTSLGLVIEVSTFALYYLHILDSKTYKITDYNNEHEYIYISNVNISEITTLFRPITNKLTKKLYLS